VVDKTKVTEFWNWFKENESKLNSDKITADLIKLLDEKISSIGFENWEIREGFEKDNMLVISPGGDVNLLVDTKYIVALSPELNDWEFYHYKPAKSWDYKFSIEDFDAKRMLDASDWEYVLLKFPDGTYDIIIKADTLKVLPEKYHMIAADIVLESIIGEELSLKLIKDIDFVEEFPNEYSSQNSSIKSLKNHLYELEGISNNQ
jgi:hypothetical protein